MIKRILAASAAAAALVLGLSAPGALAVEPRPDKVSASNQALAGVPAVTPSPEIWERKRWSQAQATDWVNKCPAGRFCTWIRHTDSTGTTYAIFQFYRCQVYSLSNWLGTTNYFNNQTRRVELLGSRHEHLRYMSVGKKFITNWDNVWYINLCA
ncbi:hypothetical protein [Kribbella sindirgiensis]|uniref:Peptidase inhibitor family I36 protein n=1 Tax=Kribbella sindirgiensis TaxID=1124744 RepID=A0A4R0IEY0_9ACTN|nr:hypothetical protein [Kribbella sindirgiensis]TCC30564.1 hypothetical protein E0H50_24485 [Kribbella sindirgiensis]